MTLHKRLLGKVRGAGATLGALECWPTNVVGEADSPCLFELVAAGAHSDDIYIMMQCLSVCHEK